MYTNYLQENISLASGLGFLSLPSGPSADQNQQRLVLGTPALLSSLILCPRLVHLCLSVSSGFPSLTSTPWWLLLFLPQVILSSQVTVRLSPPGPQPSPDLSPGLQVALTLLTCPIFSYSACKWLHLQAINFPSLMH